MAEEAGGRASEGVSPPCPQVVLGTSTELQSSLKVGPLHTPTPCSTGTPLSALSRELFNAAFVSCWMELTTAQQEDLVANLKLALSVPNIPEITQTLLNLAEFMEHCEEASVRRIVAMVPQYLSDCPPPPTPGPSPSQPDTVGRVCHELQGLCQSPSLQGAGVPQRTQH